jgi:ParB family chromosome partitioning protein
MALAFKYSGVPVMMSSRLSKFDRIIEKAPAMFSAALLRVFLRALVTIDPYAFDDV